MRSVDISLHTLIAGLMYLGEEYRVVATEGMGIRALWFVEVDIFVERESGWKLEGYCERALLSERMRRSWEVLEGIWGLRSPRGVLFTLAFLKRMMGGMKSKQVSIVSAQYVSAG